MNDEWLFDHQEKRYYHEIETRDRLTGRQQLSLGLLLVLAGLISFMARDLAAAPSSVWAVICWILLGLSIGCLIVGGYYFKRSWFGHEQGGQSWEISRSRHHLRRHDG
jgi:hypothetical protein